MSDFTLVQLLNQKTPVIITGGYVPRGAYDNATDYAVGDSVDYLSSSYVMYVDAAAGTLPTDTTKWQIIANKGATGSQGIQGETGETGTAATATAGTTTTGAAGSDASVVNSGTTAAAVFDFTIPRGDTGATGSAGADGADGADGAAATIAVGTVTTVDPSDPATVTNSGTSAVAVFDFEIPKGDPGTSGHVIKDEGTPLTARAGLNFVGAGVTATDDAGNDQTIVTIPSTDITGKASLALDNLASVAINTSLISDTDSTDDLGSTTKQWANVHTDRLVSTISDLVIENDLSDGDITFKVNDGGVDKTVMTLDGATGNVGIGTIGPAGKLDVRGGDIYFASNASSLTSTTTINLVHGTNTDTRAAQIFSTNDGSNGIGFGIRTSTAAAPATFLSYENTWLGGSTFRFYTRPSETETPLERVTISSTGNVGIGTTSPQVQLHLGTSVGKIRLADSVGSYSEIWHDASSTDNLFIANQRASSGDIIFRTAGGSDRVTITSAGNVGIGTTSPQVQLHLGTSVGKIRLADSVGSYSEIWHDAFSTDNLFIANQRASSGDIIFRTAGGSDRVTITSAGNVGIGTTSPTAKLHLPAGTASANTAPLKLAAGTNLTTPELGAIEFTDNGTDGKLYITLNVGGVLTRKEIAFV